MSIAAITISNRRIAARAFQLQYGYTPERPVISKFVGRYPTGGMTLSFIYQDKPTPPTILSPVAGEIVDSSQLEGLEYTVSSKLFSNCSAYLMRFTVKRNGVLVADMRIIDNSEEGNETNWTTMCGIMFPQVIHGSPAGDWTIEAFALNDDREISAGSVKVNFTVI